MNQKIRELTEKLYREGVEKAEVKGQAILEEAEKQRRDILSEAEKQSQALIGQGRKTAAKLLSQGKSELALASRQALSAFKQRLLNLLANDILSRRLNVALDDKEFLQKLIADLVSHWDNMEKSPDIRVVLSHTKREEFADYLQNALAVPLMKGLELRFEGRMSNGFTLEAKNGSFKLNFSDKDFEEYFKSFVKETIQALLFTEN